MVEVYKRKQRKTDDNSILQVSIFICIVLANVYVFGCMSALRILNPIEALFFLTPIYAFEILLAGIGEYFIFRYLYDNRTLPNSISQNRTRYAVVFTMAFAVAFMLECTLFQYNHYGVLFSSTSISTEDDSTDWSTLRMASMSVGSEGVLNINYYFSLTGVFDGTKEEVQEKLDNLNNRGLTTPSNSMDKEYEAMLEETERIAKEEGIEEAYPLPLEYEDNMAIARFNDLSVPISSIYIEPLFLGEGSNLSSRAVNNFQVMIIYGDEDSSLRQTMEYNIVKDMKYTWYIPLYSAGKVSDLSVCFIGDGAAFSVIKLNEPIPLTPVFLRLLIVAGLILLVYVLKRHDIFSIQFSENDKKQRLAFFALLFGLFCYCLIMAVFTIQYVYEDGSAGQYNHYLVDSILEGRLDLDLSTSTEFAAIDRKYDEAYWSKYYGIEPMGDKVHWDTVYYEGKWFTYFGIVPALLFFVPYTAITGNYLPYSCACLIQGYAALVFLLLIWRRFFRKYLSNLPFVIFILTSLALAFCSFVPFLIRRSFFYETANLGGLMFCTAGFWLLLRYCDGVGKHRYAVLTSSCFCFALAVGCRPIMLLSSVLVPLFLWPEIKKARYHGIARISMLICSVIIPYLFVAIPLMWYNNARFGSPFDFGSTYQVTILNIAAQNLLNPIGRLYRCLTGVVANLFNSPNYMTTFPYVDVKEVVEAGTAYVPQYLGAVGLLTIPVSWFMFAWVKSRDVRDSVPLMMRFVLVTLFVCVVSAALSSDYSIQPRYEIDYAWLVMLASLASLLPLYRANQKESTRTFYINRLTAVACVASIVVFFFLSFRGGVSTQPGTDNMAFYYYVARAFSFFQGV